MDTERDQAAIARPAPTAGTSLSARQLQIRSLLQALGMLPVLIILAVSFFFFV